MDPGCGELRSQAGMAGTLSLMPVVMGPSVGTVSTRTGQARGTGGATLGLFPSGAFGACRDPGCEEGAAWMPPSSCALGGG